MAVQALLLLMASAMHDGAEQTMEITSVRDILNHRRHARYVRTCRGCGEIGNHRRT
jgi:hypothetical protein